MIKCLIKRLSIELFDIAKQQRFNKKETISLLRMTWINFSAIFDFPQKILTFLLSNFCNEVMKTIAENLNLFIF